MVPFLCIQAVRRGGEIDARDVAPRRLLAGQAERRGEGAELDRIRGAEVLVRAGSAPCGWLGLTTSVRSFGRGTRREVKAR